MIPPRPFRRKRSYTLAAAVVLLAAFLSFSSFYNLFGLRSVLISAVYPFQFITNVIWKGATGIPLAILNLRNLSAESVELKAKLSISQAKLALLDELAAENERLRAALGFQASNPYRLKLLPAQVMGRGNFSILLVNRGSSAGARVDLPVVVEEGLVGRVVEVARFSSKVLLITDAGSGVAAVDQRSRDYGVVNGYSLDKLSMNYVSSSGDVKEGDKIATSSISSVFPPGIPIGTVTRASKKEHDLFYQIEIKPAVDFSRLEEVFLVF